MKNITDAALEQNVILLKKYLVLGFLLFTLLIAVGYLHHYTESVAINKVKRDMKTQLFHKVLRMRYSKFSEYHSGDLVSRFMNDINISAGLIGGNLLDLIRLPLTFIAVFIYLFSLNWQLSLLALSVTPFIIVTGITSGLLLKENSRLINQNYSNVTSFLNDSLTGFTIIRTFTLERLMHKRYKKFSDQLLSLELKNAKLSGVMNAGASASSMIAFFIIIGFGTSLVANGQITVGTLIAFLTLMQWLVHPFTGMASCWSRIQNSISAFERVWAILGSDSEFKNFPDTITSNRSAVSVELNNISFGYNSQNMVIQNLNLSIPAGSTIALVGASGAGKSTLLKLLLGLYPPTEGEILYDKQSIANLSSTKLRSLIAYVPQDTYLFDGTIRENLLHGNLRASHLELVKATKDANIYEFIMSLPEQFESNIGERGVKLSGGQKQRLSIARALLKDAPILLLDEATSALDYENEIAVQESLRKLMHGRTTIIIAHRLSTIQYADSVIVLDKGKIMENKKCLERELDYIS